jgi:hypothetical protein
MKRITKYINERLVLSKTHASDEYGYIDEMPLGPDKSKEVFKVIYKRYNHAFTDVKLLKSGNVKLGYIDMNYNILNGLYNDSTFTLYIYEDEYVMRRSVPGSVGKFVKGLNSLEKTLEKFDNLLTKRGYKNILI